MDPTSLPVLHLKTTSRYNMTITDDPYDTTATLYTFLRSLPSAAELELAYRPFLESLQTAPSSGKAALLRKPNHRLVQTLEAVALDEVFGRAPHVLPALARHSEKWLQRLGYHPKLSESTDSAPTTSRGSERVAAGAAVSPSPGAAAQLTTHVRSKDLRQYADPYSAYETDYEARLNERDGAGGLSGRKDAAGGDVSPSSSSRCIEKRGADVDASPFPSGPCPGRDLSFPSAEVSALTAPVYDSFASDEAPHDGRDVVSVPGMTTAFSIPSSASSNLHPVLDLIAHQALPNSASCSPRVEAGPFLENEREASITSLMARLRETEAQLEAAMQSMAESEQVWSPHYSRLKTSRMFVEELAGRVQSAASLLQLLQYERGTLQQAHLGVAMESLSLQLVLRDVRARLQEFESGVREENPQSRGDQELAMQLTEALCQARSSYAESRRSGSNH